MQWALSDFTQLQLIEKLRLQKTDCQNQHEQKVQQENRTFGL